jgi:hypothetical protein
LLPFWNSLLCVSHPQWINNVECHPTCSPVNPVDQPGGSV